MSPEFYQPNVADNANKTALVLLQGSGEVRAGIWTRSVCINENFGLGSMIPQVEWAIQKGYPVLVMNPNYCHDPQSGQQIPMMGSSHEHAVAVWRQYVEPSGFGRVHIIAHSAGGFGLSTI